MKTKLLLMLLAFGLMAGGAQAEVVTYDFEDGSMQGWYNLVGAGEDFVWAWNRNWAMSSGDYLIMEENFADRDSDTNVSVLTSPMFSGPISVEIWALGGIGDVATPTWTNYADLPTVATLTGGFLGVALRRVSDGEYLLFDRRSANGEGASGWEALGWDAPAIAAAVAGDSPGELYVVDIIDTYTAYGAWPWWAWIAFDDITLTADLVANTENPSPAQGTYVHPTSNLDLSWTKKNLATGDPVYVDVWFGTGPDALSKIVDATTPAGEDANSVMVDVSVLETEPTTYYWQVDSYLSGSPTGDPSRGPLLRFHVLTDFPIPPVEAGPDMITWSGQAVQLAPTIIIVDGGVSSLTYAWSADPDDGVVFTPNDGGDGSTSSAENPTVTITPGGYAANILNAGFESPVIADGAFNSTFIGWTEIFAGGVAGVKNPSAGQMYGGIAPEGENIMYASGGQYIKQILTETVAADTTYELTVKVGRFSTYPISYKVQLLAGGTVLAEDDSSLTIAEDTFEPSTVTYASGATPAQLGEPLEIRLYGTGSEINFDDVRLTADPPFPAGPQTVTLTLWVHDGVSSDEDTMIIEVYDNSCQAAIGLGEEIDSGDFDADCDTDLEDFAAMAQKWLVDTDLADLVELIKTWTDHTALTAPKAKYNLGAWGFTTAEYTARRDALMTFIPDGIGLFLGSEKERQNSNFIYFTGVERPSSVLFVDGINKESVLFLSSMESSETIKAETGVDSVLPLSDVVDVLSSYDAQTDVIYTPTEYLTWTWSEVDAKEDLYLRFKDFGTSPAAVQSLLDSFTYANLNPAVGMLRAYKSPAEIEAMRDAGRMASLAYMEILRAAKPGMYEWEIVNLFADSVKNLGGQGHADNPIVPSGPNIWNGHYIANTRKTEDGDIVLADMCAEYKYYNTDVGVSFPINGKFNPDQALLNEIICITFDAMDSVFRPGISSSGVRDEVKPIVLAQGYDIDAWGVVAVHGDHWLGLDTHDVSPNTERYPRATILEAGMVVTSDPTLKIKDSNDVVIDGNKIEHDVLITEDGCEDFNYLIPRTVSEIEKIMAE